MHATKALSRPIVNVGTLGVGTPFVSAAEDAGSATLSIVAILAPLLVIVVLVLIGFVVYRLFQFRRRW